MKLSYRKAEYEDAISSFDLVTCYYSDQVQHAYLPELWRKWMSDGAMLGFVVKDADLPVEQRIVAIGMIVFLTYEFLDEILTKPSPFIAERVVRESIRGKSPVLNAKGIARANAGSGLNVFIHAGVRELSSVDPLYHPVIDQISDSYFWRFAGFNVKEHIKETINQRMLHWVLAMGFAMRSDFGRFIKKILN